MYYYVTILNYTKNGLERTLILNPQFSREEIRQQMEKERVDSYLIEKMEQEGIFWDREITFKVEPQMVVYWKKWCDEDGSLIGTSEMRFAKKDEVTFHANGSLSWKYYTPFEKVRMFCTGVANKVKALFCGQN